MELLSGLCAVKISPICLSVYLEKMKVRTAMLIQEFYIVPRVHKPKEKKVYILLIVPVVEKLGVL